MRINGELCTLWNMGLKYIDPSREKKEKNTFWKQSTQSCEEMRRRRCGDRVSLEGEARPIIDISSRHQPSHTPAHYASIVLSSHRVFFFWLCVPPQGFPANFGCCYWCHRRDRGEAVLEKCPSIVYCPLLPCNNCSPLHPLVHSSNALTYYPRRLSTRMWSGHETFSFYSW